MLCSKMGAAELSLLIVSLDQDFENPNIKTHFPPHDMTDDAEKEPSSKESHKRAMI